MSEVEKKKKVKKPKDEEEKITKKDKDEKKKKSSSSGEKENKEKKSSKEKSSSSKSKTSEKDKTLKSASKTSASSTPSKPQVKQRAPKTQVVDQGGGGYMAGFELPPSDDEDEYERNELEDDEKDKKLDVVMTAKQAKKIQDKERKLMEKAYQIKQEALKEDDDVFDISYEGMGGDESALANASDIKINNMTMRAKGKILLDGTNLTITRGRRYGLVGPNGHGKSTLLRLLAQRRLPVPENIDVLLVEQEVVADERSALQAVVEADVQLMELRDQEKHLNEMINSDETEEEEKNELSAQLNQVYEEIEKISGSSAEARASKILHGLGFTKAMQGRSTKSFSGGWRMRISLARALYIQPTLLMLDEPTNHLDLRAVLWLEEYLLRYKKTLITVSHDREFLNMVTTDIIDLHDLGLHQYRGNFAEFEEMKLIKRKQMNKDAELYEKQMKAAKQSGNKANQKKVQEQQARKDRHKGDKGKDQSSSSQPKNAPPKRFKDYTVNFSFPDPTDLGSSQLLSLMDVDFKYPGRDDFGLKNVNIGVDLGSKVAIVGPNGAGKSTLMNLLAGDIEPLDGTQKRPHHLRIGRYAQHFVDLLKMEDTPVEYLMSRYPSYGKAEDCRAVLGKFGLKGHHHMQPICKLSGGQKSRVVFSGISLSNPHILLLDEPTNHLDMQSIDALCEAVAEFEGGVVVISHDAQLLNSLCEDEERSEVWVVDNGEIMKHPGDFEDYKNELIAEIRAELDEDD
eukprot:TRINITY_DN6861_c0_g1_i4.p1 TRINITY_DN6861_c0_g1~~TRINITY_DN6861_c0_g1_i4.p1  ORF type:complete len:740 (-),score=178.24 TRINITY_DN6861_c0_g1_i4:265-2484(-)